MKKILVVVLCILMILPVMEGMPAYATETVNLLRNTGFEMISDGSIEKWPGAVPDAEIKHSGNYSAKLTNVAGANSLMAQGVNDKTIPAGERLRPGGIYKISAYIKAELVSPKDMQGFCFKFEFSGPADEAGVTTRGEWWSDRWKDFGDDWIVYEDEFELPDNTESISVIGRIMGCAGTVWLDDIKLTFVGAPAEMFDFEIGDVFHYPHEEKGYATVTLNCFYENEAAAIGESTVDFKLCDGDKVLTALDGAHFTDMKAEFSYPINLLKEMKKAYTVHATAKWRDKVRTFTQNVYVYPRPTMIHDDNRIYYGNEIFNPVIAYSTGSELDRYAEIGVNVCQRTLRYNQPGAFLDVLEEYDRHDLKILCVLYAGSVSAVGNEKQLQNTIDVVTALKNDDRIFAWALMDEPFGGGVTEQMKQEMELAYRTIRNIDDKHPVYICCPSTFAQKYCDISLSDSYAFEDNRSVSAAFGKYKEQKGEVHKLYLGCTFYQNGAMQTIRGYRGSVYRAYEGGAKGIGYYRLEYGGTPYFDEALQKNTNHHLWEEPLWDELALFAENELPVLSDIFVNNKYQEFNVYDENTVIGDYWGIWTDGKVMYMIVHNRSNAEKTINVPLISKNGFVSVGAYTLNCLGGTPKHLVENGDSISVTLAKQDEVLYQLTPLKPIDLSAVSKPNILPNFGFESTQLADGKTFPEDWTENTAYPPMYMTDAETGNKYINFPARTSRIATKIPVKPDTSYLVGFDFKSGEAAGVRFAVDYYVGDIPLDTYIAENVLTPQAHWMEKSTGTMESIPQGATVESLPWQKAKMQYKTPLYADTAVISLRGNGADEDAFACVDNAYMIELGSTSNLIANGGFEYFDNEEERICDGWETPYADGSGTIEYITDRSGTYLKLSSAGDAVQENVLKQDVWLAPGKYMLSFRHKAETAGDSIRIGFDGIENVGGSFGNTFDFGSVTAGEWKNYTCSFTVSQSALQKVSIQLPASDCLKGTHYFDDVVLVADKTSVDFHSTIETYSDASKRSGAKFIPLSKISDSILSDNVYTVETRVHYLPENNAEEKLQFVSCVYRYTQNAKELYSVSVKDITVPAGGYAMDVTDSVSVPVKTGGERYEVEVFLWNLASGMQPGIQSVTLEY